MEQQNGDRAALFGIPVGYGTVPPIPWSQRSSSRYLGGLLRRCGSPRAVHQPSATRIRLKPSACLRSPAAAGRWPLRVQPAVTPAGLGRSCQSGATEVAPRTSCCSLRRSGHRPCWRCLGRWPTPWGWSASPGALHPASACGPLGGWQGVLKPEVGERPPPGGQAEIARASHTVTYPRQEQERISSS
jgi:hypothetical protein